jgi:hypothetical protein
LFQFASLPGNLLRQKLRIKRTSLTCSNASIKSEVAVLRCHQQAELAIVQPFSALFPAGEAEISDTFPADSKQALSMNNGIASANKGWALIWDYLIDN